MLQCFFFLFQIYRVYTAFPDFFHNSITEWWMREIAEVYTNPRNASQSLKFNGIWIVSVENCSISEIFLHLFIPGLALNTSKPSSDASKEGRKQMFNAKYNFKSLKILLLNSIIISAVFFHVEKCYFFKYSLFICDPPEGSFSVQLFCEFLKLFFWFRFLCVCMLVFFNFVLFYLIFIISFFIILVYYFSLVLVYFLLFNSIFLFSFILFYWQ